MAINPSDRTAALVIATGVERVALEFGKPTQRWVDRLTLRGQSALDANQFDKGSMGPKIGAVIEFLEGGGTEGMITDASHLAPALAGTAGARIVLR